MAQRWTQSETLFAEYLTTHGYQLERDLDWRSRFGLDTSKNPDFLLSRAREELGICEVKEFTDTPVDRRLAAGCSSGPGTELYSSAGDAVRQAAGEQLRPFADVGLPLVVVLANPHGKVVALAPNTMPMSLFGITETVVFDVGPGAPTSMNPRFILSGPGALVDERPAFRAKQPHPYLSAVVVLHARREADTYFEDMRAQQRRARPPRSDEEAIENDLIALDAFDHADQEGRVPSGEYEWVTVFDLSAHPQFRGTPLPSRVFDGNRDLRFDLTSNATFEPAPLSRRSP